MSDAGGGKDGAQAVALPTDVELLRVAGETYQPGSVPYFEDADHAIRVFFVLWALCNPQL